MVARERNCVHKNWNPGVGGVGLSPLHISSVSFFDDSRSFFLSGIERFSNEERKFLISLEMKFENVDDLSLEYWKKKLTGDD